MKLAIVYKNFALNPNVSHIGLGVAALNNAKVLKRHGIHTVVWPINQAKDLIARLEKDPDVTHVVISAAWLTAFEIGNIAASRSDVEFTSNIHSNVGFLQADANGVAILKQYMALEREILNFRVSGNSQKFKDWLKISFDAPSTYLPNLYYLDDSVHSNKPLYNGGTLRIGAFGANRPQKNIMSAAGAALAIAAELKVDVEFWVSGGRFEGGGHTIINAVRRLLENQPGIILKELNWMTWSDFRKFVRHMHLLFNVSYTESFNMVTADGVAEGVPAVVSAAIDWAPEYWQVDEDNVLDMARVGRQLITDPYAARDGLKSLEKHNHQGFMSWLRFLGCSPMQYMSGVYPTL